MKSVKYNYFFNLICNIIHVLYPIITFPYLSRVLLPAGMGKVDFINGLISYFILFAQLGIPLYGTREIAKHLKNKTALDSAFSEIFTINCITMLISYLGFVLLLIFSQKLRTDYIICLIASLSIISSCIGSSWLYNGIEKYEFITIRSLLSKILSLILVFTLVKSPNDSYIVIIIYVIELLWVNIMNLVFIRKYVTFIMPKMRSLLSHIKPILVIFGLNIALSLNGNIELIFLGYLADDKSTGYFGAAIKLTRLIIALLSSLSTVMITRLSFFLKNNQISEYKSTATKALNYIIFIALPSSVGLYLLAPELVLLFSGNFFTESGVVLKLLSPVIFVISLSNFVGIQVLYSKGKENIVFISVIIGMVIDIFLNILLIPIYSYKGSAYANLISQIIVLLIQITAGRKHFGFNLLNKNYLNYIIATLLMTLIIIFIRNIISNSTIYLVVSVVSGIAIYFASLLILRENVVLNEIKSLIFRKKKN